MKRSTLLLAICAWAAAGVVLAEPTRSHGYLVVSDGLKIHYVVVGRGTPVILIHGAGGSAVGNWFANGIAQALAKNHRVVAIDCRGHGQSDNPPGGAMPNRVMAQDVIELMDHLDIAKAHVHGYSMGGAICEQMLARYPERLMTVAFGGWGIPEVDPEIKAKVPPDKQGADPQEAELYAKFRAALAERNQATGSEQDAEKNRPKHPGKGRDDGSRPTIDLTQIKIPVLAINGEFDRPNAKTHRMQRELANFTSVVLAGKSHLSAIVAGSIPPLYTDTLVEFINSNDPK
ncbi:MAG: alpha/beta hydrolase [Pirellulales bacterium]